jgi:hypothetical protein
VSLGVSHSGTLFCTIHSNFHISPTSKIGPIESVSRVYTPGILISVLSVYPGTLWSVSSVYPGIVIVSGSPGGYYYSGRQTLETLFIRRVDHFYNLIFSNFDNLRPFWKRSKFIFIPNLKSILIFIHPPPEKYRL